MKAILNNGKKVNITGYDLSANRFDCDDGMTRIVNNFKEFTLD